jgi:ADP-heptose:LPS heptosyltransferase
MKKNSVRILAGRCQLLGDMYCGLAVTSHYKKLYPEAEIIFPIAGKCAQAAPLYFQHPDINTIYIFDGKEGPESARDFDLIKSCDITVDPNPQHPMGENWFNERNVYEETWIMAGLELEDYKKLNTEDQCPRLYKNFTLPIKHTQKKVIGIWAQAGYAIGNTSKRNPSKSYWQDLINNLISKDFEIWQFGSERDWVFDSHPDLKRFNSQSFFDQIRYSLLTDLVLGTDSGSSLILGGYRHPQISLLRMYKEDGHNKNPLAFSSINPNNYSFVSESDTHDSINQNLLIQKIYQKLI